LEFPISSLVFKSLFHSDYEKSKERPWGEEEHDKVFCEPAGAERKHGQVSPDKIEGKKNGSGNRIAPTKKTFRGEEKGRGEKKDMDVISWERKGEGVDGLVDLELVKQVRYVEGGGKSLTRTWLPIKGLIQVEM